MEYEKKDFSIYQALSNTGGMMGTIIWVFGVLIAPIQEFYYN
jgi:hypothetical protein